MKRLRLSLVLVFISAGPAAAEETPTTLSLAAAVTRALEVDQSYRSVREGVAGAEAGVKAARAAFYPTVSLDVSATQILGLPATIIPADSMGPGFPPTDVEFSAGYPQNLEAGVTGTQPLYMGGRFRTSYRMSKVSYDLARASLRQARGDTITAVVRAYYDAVLADDGVRVADAGVALATIHVQATEDRYNAGLVSEYDVLRARVQRSNLMTAQRRAADGRALTYHALRALLDLPPDAPLALTDRLAFRPEVINLEEGLARAADQRPELLQLEYSRRLADEAVKMARAGDNPSLMFIASYSDYANGFTLNFADEWRDMGTLVLSFSWPLFDGLLTRAKVAQARADLRKAEFGKVRLQEGIDIDIRRAYDALATLAASVRAQEENVKLAQRGLEIAEARYEAGLMSNLEVLDAQAALTQAQLGYYQSLHDYELAKYDWRRARGDLDEMTF